MLKLSNTAQTNIANYEEIKEQRFPGISYIQSGYYDKSLSKDQKSQYLKDFPELKEYWDWNAAYKKQFPEVQTWLDDRSNYFNEMTCYQSYADMSESTQKQLEYAKATGKPMSNTAIYELNQLYGKYADPDYLTMDAYIKLLQNWE